MNDTEMNADEMDEIEMDDTKLFAVYCKPGSEYYVSKLEQYRDGKKYTFNVYAFFFGIFWFMYRKMYVEAFLILVVIVAEGFLEEMFTANMSQSAVTAISRITTIALGIITAMFANALYIRKAEREIIKAKQGATSNAALISRVEQKGGVSYWFLVAVLVAVASIGWYFYRLNNEG